VQIYQCLRVSPTFLFPVRETQTGGFLFSTDTKQGEGTGFFISIFRNIICHILLYLPEVGDPEANAIILVAASFIPKHY
jgi:hypothetical protein